MGLRKFLDKIEHHFEQGGRFEKWYALYEAVGYFSLSPRQCDQNHCPRARWHRPETDDDDRVVLRDAGVVFWHVEHRLSSQQLVCRSAATAGAARRLAL